MSAYTVGMLSITLAAGSVATGVLAIVLAIGALIEQRAEQYEIDRLIWVPVNHRAMLD